MTAKRAAMLELCGILAPKDKRAAGKVARSLDEPGDLSPPVALVEALGPKRVGEVDWKWQFPDILHAIRPQLARHKVKATDVDWTLEPRWDEVDTVGCLKAAGGFLRRRKLVLASIDTDGDSYALIVVDEKTFAAARKAAKGAGVKLTEWRGRAPPAAATAGPGRLKIDKQEIRYSGDLCGIGADWLVFGSDSEMIWADTSRWPPRITVSPGGTRAAARRADGAWLSMPYRPGDAPLRIHARAGAPPSEPLPADPPVAMFDVVGWLGRRALGIPSTYGLDGPAVPYLQDGKMLRPAPGLRGTRTFNTRYGFAPFGTGGVVIWDGNGWEMVKGTFARTLRLGWQRIDGQVIAVGNTIYALSNGRLMELRRGKPAVAHLGERTFSKIGPGPAGSVLVWSALADGGVVGSIYFPATREEIRLQRKMLGISDCKWLAWSTGSHRLFVGFHVEQLWSIRGEDVLALPRIKT